MNIHKVIKIVIFIIHIALLGWIVYLLGNGGNLKAEEIVYHFVGIGFLGVGLIRYTSKIEMYFFKKEQLKRNEKK